MEIEKMSRKPVVIGLVLFILMGTGTALAQPPKMPHRVFGYVTYEDGSPAVGVSVRFVDDAGGTVASDITDENGYYDTSLPPGLENNIPEPADNTLDIYVGEWGSGIVLAWEEGGSSWIDISGVPAPPAVFPPEVLGVVPSEPDWDPWEAYTIAVTVRDDDTLADLDNVVVMAYSSPLNQADPDSTRDHYTWWYDGSWHSSLGAGYMVPELCSAPDNLSVTEGTYVFAVKLAKTAEPGAWDLYAEAVDSYENRDSLESTGAVSVNVYTEFSLDRNALIFSGALGEKVTTDNSVVTVTTNANFDIQVRMSGPWAYESYTMPMGTTTANGIALTDSYQSVLADIGYGEGVATEIAWELSIPVDQEPGTYRATFYVNVAH